jgi:polysaccharide pyruvyl transferase WcaK-like protein
MDNPKILIVGTGSLLNYGCEGIVRGTINLLKDKWRNAEFYIGSDDLEYDTELFKGEPNVNFIEYKRRFSPYRVFKGMMRRIGIGQGSPVRMNTHISKKFDIFLSVGGDNYAEAPNGKLYHLLIDLMQLGKTAKLHKKAFVIWGASIGPFSQINYSLVLSNLKLADLIFVREELSYEYLKKESAIASKLNLIADPAFWMDHKDYNVSHLKGVNDLLIGLNFSQLAIDHLKGLKKEDAKKELFKQLDSILESNHNYKYVLIPHVQFENNIPQNDSYIMKEYLSFSKFNQRITLINNGLGAQKTKGLISHLDLLIAARMHCCVAGLSVSTPTLLLTYSQKGIGMAKYAYDDLSLVYNLNELFNNALNDKVAYAIMNKSTIKDKLISKNLHFRNDAQKAADILYNSLKI